MLDIYRFWGSLVRISNQPKLFLLKFCAISVPSVAIVCRSLVWPTPLGTRWPLITRVSVTSHSPLHIRNDFATLHSIQWMILRLSCRMEGVESPQASVPVACLLYMGPLFTTCTSRRQAPWRRRTQEMTTQHRFNHVLSYSLLLMMQLRDHYSMQAFQLFKHQKRDACISWQWLHNTQSSYFWFQMSL